VSTTGHVVLLGDSIFDNAAYTDGGPDVVTQVRGLLPRGWSATLAAVDGAVVSSLAAQLQRIPSDATHLVLSAGGNDALGHIGLLERDARTVGEGLALLAAAAEGFATTYREAVRLLQRRELPLTLCTIYEGNFPDPTFQRVAAASVALFDDVILRTAAAASLPVIELRLVCRAAEDYANPIEPSSVGGAKIARAILHALGLSEGTAPSTTYVD
jgi:hypothetical protein